MGRGENKLRKKTFLQAPPTVFFSYKTAGRFTSFSLRVCSPPDSMGTQRV